MFRFLFSGRGRMSRKSYWLGYILPVYAPLLLLQALTPQLVARLVIDRPNGVQDMILYSSIINSALVIVWTWIDVAVSARRFHDMNHSGWWAAAFPLASLISTVSVRVFATSGSVSPMTIGVVGLASSGTLILVRLWVLGVQRGNKGPNRYGPDPTDRTGTGDVKEVFS